MKNQDPTRLLAIIGTGRAGRALAAALGPDVSLVGRGQSLPRDAEAVLLCVPDQAVAAVAAEIRPGLLIGHTSGALGLDVLGSREAFGLHPLMSLLGERSSVRGASAAIAGSSDRALEVARELAAAAGMFPIELAPEDRVAYHAAASLASNMLLVVEHAAERLAGTAGVERAALGPLVRATLENWLELGAERALTGPIARGDEGTVARQRAAIEERAPELLPLWDELCRGARELTGAPAR